MLQTWIFQINLSQGPSNKRGFLINFFNDLSSNNRGFLTIFSDVLPGNNHGFFN